MSQRWNCDPAAYKQLSDRTGLESQVHPFSYLAPDWYLPSDAQLLIFLYSCELTYRALDLWHTARTLRRFASELLLYSKSRYQNRLLRRLIAATTDPRFVLVQFIFPQELSSVYWEPVNLDDKKRQGFDMRGKLGDVHWKLSPLWERIVSDTKVAFPKTMQGIDDLRNFAYWYFTDNDGGKRRFPVRECVVLERALRGSGPGVVDFGGRRIANVRSMHMRFMESESTVGLFRRDYTVKLAAALQPLPSVGDGKEDDDLGEDDESVPRADEGLSDDDISEVQDGFSSLFQYNTTQVTQVGSAATSTQRMMQIFSGHLSGLTARWRVLFSRNWALTWVARWRWVWRWNKTEIIHWACGTSDETPLAASTPFTAPPLPTLNPHK